MYTGFDTLALLESNKLIAVFLHLVLCCTSLRKIPVGEKARSHQGPNVNTNSEPL